MIKVDIPTMEEVARFGRIEEVNPTEFATKNGQDFIRGFLVRQKKDGKKRLLGFEPCKNRFVAFDENYDYGLKPIIRLNECEEDEKKKLLYIINNCNSYRVPITLGAMRMTFKNEVLKQEYHNFCEKHSWYGNGVLIGKKKEDLLSLSHDALADDYLKMCLLHKAIMNKEYYNSNCIQWDYDAKQQILFCKDTVLGVPLQRKQNKRGALTFPHNIELEGLQSIINQAVEKISLYQPERYDQKDLASACHFEVKKNLSAEEKMEYALEAGLPVFLHGKPGEGKSARAKAIDPDYTMLELCLSPMEDLAGMNEYVNGKLIKRKPEWLVELEQKCQKEPFQTHILFLDELTNAEESIQSLAYSLVLKRTVANEWKLPANVGIIATGNEVEDSAAATEMPEPLRDRFVHINVHTSLEEWLDWAGKNEIHPAIISYLTFRGESALRSQKKEGEIYTTPRTWERASKMLNATNDVRDLFPVIGDYQATDFIAFCNMMTIDKEDIINGNVDSYVFDDMDIAMKMAMVRSLNDVTIEEFETVRNFVKTAGKEPLALFENLWISGAKEEKYERLEKVAEIHMEEEEQEGVGTYEY